MSTPGTSRTTTAFYAQAALSFGIALLAVVLGICYLPVDPWQRAFLAMGALFLVSSSFTLAKVVRDNQEQTQVVARLDEARVERLLAEHDPFKAA
ncbi:YiaA/YiaB family inner membrane protein [Nocardioides caldifontis]|uniref:YiaA/YiaB family inner membrane protein n=1 Tax=Nocardioides caldifontis TaxID=2588938 RepID=UPI0011E011F3|nr:YiaA/YiaB family inner membrane protein [Nocardioides caldifontis]